MENLNQRIEKEPDPTRKYWLKQARMHFRSAETHRKKGASILLKLNTYGPGEKLKVG